VLRKKGDLKGAIKYYEQALRIKEMGYGDNNLSVAFILTNMGLVYMKMGDLDQSIKFYKDAITMKKLICGEKSIILCGTYDNLGRVYYHK
jgi:tetratricopeptide (TPR) repeat protein